MNKPGDEFALTLDEVEIGVLLGLLLDAPVDNEDDMRHFVKQKLTAVLLIETWRRCDGRA
ncbi:MAG: hypothetical protein K8F91_15740 [Candidatus Obscuribacterales bacterium]|nr:hypothetical protein [Candidatus Obscuribacterales bacterium]